MTDFSSYETVMARMLDNVSNDVDKREGSVIWDAIAPCARELVNMYAEITQALDNTFAGTADREWLIKRCAEIGVVPYPATYAIRKGKFTPVELEIPIGSRFSYEDTNFRVTEKDPEGTAGVYHLECEELGEIGNDGSGLLVPIEYIQGLETATLLSEVVVFGEEEEDTEALRTRYFESLPTMTLDGNVAQYEKWCREYAGIGNYKVFPEWNGKNTVKVSILSSENTVASEYLIDEFQEYLDPKASPDDTHGEGLGMGKAPIGAIVTVSTATEVPINVHAQLALRDGFDRPVNVETELEEYFHSLNYTKTLVSYVAVSAVLQNNYSIEATLDVTMNGEKTNITLKDEEICKLGEFTYEIVA